MLGLHRRILVDKVRNDAFARALKEMIIPGKTTVADVGSGTGFLGFLAVKLGCRKCVLYESSPVVHLSRRLARENKIGRCMFIHGHSTHMKQPELVDLIISETLGHYALEEHILETLEDAKRFLKPGGRIIPARLEQFIVPVVTDRIMRSIDPWDRIGFDLKFTAARRVSLNNMYVQDVTAADLYNARDAVRTWDLVDFGWANNSIRRGKVSWQFTDPSEVFGFCLFWEVELSPGVRLTTSPWSPPTHWGQVFLPLLTPLRLCGGYILTVHLISDTRTQTGMRLRWTTTVRTGRGMELQRAVMDTWKGDLRRTATSQRRRARVKCVSSSSLPIL